MAFPDAKDDEQRAATRALMKSLRYVESTRDAASVTELCEVIVGKMRASYHKDERPGGIVAWLSNDHMITLARQSPDPEPLHFAFLLTRSGNSGRIAPSARRVKAR